MCHVSLFYYLLQDQNAPTLKNYSHCLQRPLQNYRMFQNASARITTWFGRIILLVRVTGWFMGVERTAEDLDIYETSYF